MVAVVILSSSNSQSITVKAIDIWAYSNEEEGEELYLTFLTHSYTHIYSPGPPNRPTPAVAEQLLAAGTVTSVDLLRSDEKSSSTTRTYIPGSGKNKRFVNITHTAG